MKRARELFAMMVIGAAVPAGAAIEGTTWFPIGPAPIDGSPFPGGVSGRASAIAVNPENPDEIWLGTAAGGVWHSRDGGANWKPRSDREDSLAIGAIALDGCTAAGCSAIYAGTGENAIRRDTYYGAGLLIGEVSEFETISWTQRTGFPFDFRFASINDVVLDPTTSGASKRIFVTLSSGVTASASGATVPAPAPTGGYGIYRSDDKGVSWSKLTVDGANDAKPTDLEMHPGDPNILFAGFLERGVFRSADKGDTWCPLNAGIPQPPDCRGLTLTLPDVGTTTFDHVEIAIAPGDPQIVYATFGMCRDALMQSCRPAVFRSEDGGTSWTLKLAGSPNDMLLVAHEEPAYGYSRYTHGLAVDPINAEILLGGVALWRSTNRGMLFVRSNANSALGPPGPPGPRQPVIHHDHREIVFHPTATHRVYSTGDGGFATSTDRGVTWTPRNDGLQITGFQGIGSSPLTGAVIGTSQDNGGQLWSGRRRWEYLRCCGDGGYSFLDFDNVLRMYAGSNFGSLHRSTDGGVSWHPIDNGFPFPDPEPRLMYAPFVQGPTPVDGNHPLYYGKNRLFRSTNDGDLWSPVSPVLATGAATEILTVSSFHLSPLDHPGQNVITAIAVAPSNPDRVYIGYYGGEVFRSDPAPCGDDRSCWPRIDIDSRLPDAPVTRIAVHPTHPDIAYATFSGFGDFARVWKTINGGTTWNPAAGGLPAGIPANTVSIEPSEPSEPSEPERVYVGLDSGPDGASLFRSTNGGETWLAFAEELPQRSGLRDLH